MLRASVIALTVVVLLAGRALTDDQGKKDKDGAKPAHVTITKLDAKKGEITVKYTDDTGKTREKTFQLTKDVRLLDETGRLVKIDVFESGNDALVLESAGKVRELRRAPNRGATRQLSDSVRTLMKQMANMSMWERIKMMTGMGKAGAFMPGSNFFKSQKKGDTGHRKSPKERAKERKQKKKKKPRGRKKARPIRRCRFSISPMPASRR